MVRVSCELSLLSFMPLYEFALSLHSFWSLHGGCGLCMWSCFTIEFEGVLACHL